MGRLNGDEPPQAPAPKRLADILGQLATYDPEPFRRIIIERGADLYAEGLIDALKPGHACPLCKCKPRNRWAFNAFGRIAKLVDTTPQVILAFLHQIGVKDQDELAGLVKQGRRLETMEQNASTAVEEFVEQGVELLLRCFHERPELRDEAVRMLTQKRLPEMNGDVLR